MKGSIDPTKYAFSSELPVREKIKRHYPIIRPKASQTVGGLVLSERPLITRSHYMVKRTILCIGAENGCPFCKKGIRKMVKGYLAGSDVLTGKDALIELTDNALYETPIISKSKASLRGMYCQLSRHGEAVNGKVTAYFHREHAACRKANIRPAFDVMEALLTLWDVPFFEEDPTTGELIPAPRDLWFPADTELPKKPDYKGDEEPDE